MFLNRVTLKGSIKKGDFERVRLAVMGRKPTPADPDGFPGAAVIRVDSPGGDVEEALRIAELIREAHIPVLVEYDGVCASACALIFLAAADRNAFADQVGLHRPRMLRSKYRELTSDEARAATREFTDRVRRFLEVNDVPRGLIDRMMETPSDDVYWLSGRQLERLGRFPPHVYEALLATCGAIPSSRAKSTAQDDWEVCKDRYFGQQQERWRRKQSRANLLGR